MIENEKRPQDWGLEERLTLIIISEGLSEEDCNKLCRSQGVFPTHIKDWKQQFITGMVSSPKSKKQVTVKKLRYEIKELSKDLNRINKALVETAALLVLKKSKLDLGKLRGQLTMKEERDEM